MAFIITERYSFCPKLKLDDWSASVLACNERTARTNLYLPESSSSNEVSRPHGRMQARTLAFQSLLECLFFNVFKSIKIYATH
jgi:hypothetical protein